MKLDRLEKTLRDWQEKIEENIDNRQETYDDRTEKWQESRKGEEYDELTNHLAETNDLIEGLLDVVECPPATI